MDISFLHLSENSLASPFPHLLSTVALRIENCAGGRNHVANVGPGVIITEPCDLFNAKVGVLLYVANRLLDKSRGRLA
jgi:hypothetical protein